jgi:2-polyprenyl-3-methyl-5-hydroxy-6-metoxy-1,4-benzoquinol methylase
MTPSDEFYTRLSNSYGEYANKRSRYISSVNEFIFREAGHPKTFADVGSGDGLRGHLIGDRFGTKTTLIDNSDGMLKLEAEISGVTVLKADISSVMFDRTNKYDLVTCLWNVLGHIPTPEKRLGALKNLSSILSESGILFIDVNNRYNIANYGLFSVAKNIFMDLFASEDRRGNFALKIDTKAGVIDTEVHIFCHSEIMKLAKAAGLSVSKRIVVDYKTGKERRCSCFGQLAYMLRRTS